MSPHALIELLFHYDQTFITGVPDSIFKHFLSALVQDSRFQHVITNNEGEACALAAGYHLATGKIPVVYMQNSGLGNSINPLTSLIDAHIYSIPIVLLIAWRGRPGVPDEPQHVRMGAILPQLLSLLDIAYSVADSAEEKMAPIFQQADQHLTQQKKPYAILFPNHVFQVKTSRIETDAEIVLKGHIVREQLLEWLIQHAQEDDVWVTTTGKTSRELYELRERYHQDHSRDFLTVGSMGCSASIALGIAMQCKHRRVILIDGDGACLMRMEALATIGHEAPQNFIHIVVDNNAYESTGSQKTLSDDVDLAGVANACRYYHSVTVHDLTAFYHAFMSVTRGPTMIVAKTISYSRVDLGRPKTTPIENKLAFMQRLGVTV